MPTHYIMMLGLPEPVKRGFDVDSITKLLISSAPARRETKLALMEYFRNSRLYEGYGSTETGWVTFLRPEEQLTKLGSIGRECHGHRQDQAPRRLRRTRSPTASPARLYARTPYAFQGYWKLPEKTAEAFRGDYCTVGDIARRDGDGYLYLVDRKSNMIISGGENVYPSEVEQVLGAHPKIKDVAVIGVPDEKWGEAAHAVVILHAGASASEADILEWCKDKIAGYKRPKSISFIAEDDMPRTATGKILHRVLRDRYADAQRRPRAREGRRDDEADQDEARPCRASSWEKPPAPLLAGDGAAPVRGERRQRSSTAARLSAGCSQSQGREIPLCGQRRPHLADPRRAARAWHQAHPHAPRAVMRLRRRRLGANHRNPRRLQRHRRLRT